MSLAPAEIRHAELGRGLLGYSRTEVDALLDEIVDSFEQVWRERADLADKVEQLETDMVRYKELETLLRTTLVSAERASHELKAQARKEAELLVEEAQNEARAMTRDARAERERLVGDSNRIRALLRAALQTLGAGEAEGRPAEAA
jgi:cell division initiation protein